jgi:hypothetical protein
VESEESRPQDSSDVITNSGWKRRIAVAGLVTGPHELTLHPMQDRGRARDQR